MFNNLSKVFDTLNHNLLIAKLETCGFKRESLSFMKSYIRFMSITILVLGKKSLQEQQGSLLEPLLFNIFINDLFLLDSNSYLGNYSDKKTLDVFGFNLEEVKNVLRAEFNEVTRWFYENYMTLNASKCHFLCFRKYTANEISIFKNSVMKNSKKILGVTIDNKLNCKSHIKD